MPEKKSITEVMQSENLFESYPKETSIDNGFLFQFPERTYRALEMNLQGLSKLKVNLKVSQKLALSGAEAFHIDTLDLNHHYARERFAQVSAERLEADHDQLMQELYTLIDLLEKKRAELLSRQSQAKKTPVMTEGERAEALELLRSPELIDQIQRDFDFCGYIGEEMPRLFGYIAATSRFLEKPLGLLIVSRSGAGKSSLQDAISAFIPPEQLHKYTRVTGQALFYQENGNLRYAVLAIAEEKGAEDAIYSIRTLQSDQYLTVAVTTTDPKTGKKKTEEYRVEGPVVIIITTTNPEALDFETRNRFVILTIDESREQTERILMRQRERYTLEGRKKKRKSDTVFKKHHNAQRLLYERVLQGVDIVNPFALELTYPSDKLLMRREHEKYQSLIMAIAFLRQFQKELKSAKDDDGKSFHYVEVELEDIALANTLAADALGRSLDELSPHTRTLLKQIKTMVDEKCTKEKKKAVQIAFTRKEITEHTGWSYFQVQDHLRQLVEMEFLTLSASPERNRFVYQLVWDGKGEDGHKFVSGLIDVNDLKKKFSKSQSKAAVIASKKPVVA